MKKILYRKFLLDCLLFFLISIISTGVIIWVFQAVNYLDIIIEDGRTYSIYLYYSLLNFPKIISKILPFAFFFSFSYVIAKYELNNELLIYWNFGINKFSFINFFFIFSVFVFFIQIVLTSFVVPYSQNIARSLIRTSDYDFVSNFIKTKKFNSTINNLTIFTESKDIEGNFRNIYIKKDTDRDSFQIIFAKKGILIENQNNPVLELYEGENTSFYNNRITSFSFSKSEFNLSSFSTDTILVKKTQEHKSNELLECIIVLTDKNFKNDVQIKNKVRNCEFRNLDNILAELYKRLIIPLYLPALMLISLFLIIHSKEKINYTRYRLIVFLIGFFLIIFSESTLKFVNKSFYNNLFIGLIPIIIILFLYIYIISKLNFKKALKKI
ncbi:LptF/LptG family permease [Candidatus Pelagibacter ubique]|uniref:LptF/LptG family permease n=1 Tax=Pelagibacter ubique TaxID=198252 RepID=UPI0003C7EA62